MRHSFPFCWVWILPWVKLSWHSYSMWNKLGWLNWSWQFLCEELSPFNSKRFYYSYAWSCSLFKRRISFCTRLISRKLFRFLLMFLTGFTSLSVLVLFPLLITFFVAVQFLILFHLTLMRFSRSNHLLFLSLGDFNVHHKDWVTYSGGPDRPGERCYKTTLLRQLTFLLWFLTVTLTVMLFWIYLFLLMLVSVLQWLSLHWEILMLLSQFPLTLFFFFLNWGLLHAVPNSHYKAWSYKKKNNKKITGSRKSP